MENIEQLLDNYSGDTEEEKKIEKILDNLDEMVYNITKMEEMEV